MQNMVSRILIEIILTCKTSLKIVIEWNKILMCEIFLRLAMKNVIRN
jgi:hypothetical protein